MSKSGEAIDPPAPSDPPDMHIDSKVEQWNFISSSIFFSKCLSITMVPLLVCSAMSLLFLICISGFKPRLCLTLLVHIPSEPDKFMTIFYPMSCFVTQWAQINLITISEFKLSKQLGAYNVINFGFHRVYKF